MNAYRQRGSLAAVVRIVSFDIPDWEQLHISKSIMDLADVTHGMVLVTGTAGSGKGMISMDQSILNLYKNKQISREVALEHADNPEQLQRRLG